MNLELTPYLAEQKPDVPMCHFGDMCFHNTTDCKFNHWYVLDGRKKLKKAFSKQQKFIKIESDILDIKNGKKLIWADEC